MSGTFRAGSLDCRLIVDGGGSLPVDVAFATAPADELAAALGGADRVAGPYNCLLVFSSEGVVLVDAGIGSYEHPLGGSGGRLEAALSEQGVTVDDVAVVVLTHGHLDHVGGLCFEGRPRFGRARHLISSLEWELWTDEAALAAMPQAAAKVAREQLPPLEHADLVELVEGELDVAHGVRLRPAPGHSPGQLAVELGEPEPVALYLADVVTHELHLEHPDWVMAIEPRPADVVATRHALLGRAADEGLIVAASHIDEAGLVERAGDGFRFRPQGD
jgi:glyoxylase-like metal-dependent hydrolase (beta-lactamase superfamily II)